MMAEERRTMKFSKFGHSCQLIEEGDAKILIDPGEFSQGFEGLLGLSAVLFSHQHPDHLSLKKLRVLLQNNPDMEVFGDEGTVKALEFEEGIEVLAAHAGESFDIEGVEVQVIGTDHAVIHPTIPGIPNVGFMIGGRFFYPGDNFTLPGAPVEVLAVPTCAPWMKVSEAIDFMLAVAPSVAIPVHDGLLAIPEVYFSHLRRFGETAGIDFKVVPNGESAEI
jgi:L-ascorbate metabolism protein UlaG (beta-lactamase superfamily)